MITLGISAFYHDSAVAILRDDEIIFALQEERLSRKKADSNFPNLAIKAGLNFLNSNSKNELNSALNSANSKAGLNSAQNSAASKAGLNFLNSVSNFTQNSVLENGGGGGAKLVI